MDIGQETTEDGQRTGGQRRSPESERGRIDITRQRLGSVAAQGPKREARLAQSCNHGVQLSQLWNGGTVTISRAVKLDQRSGLATGWESGRGAVIEMMFNHPRLRAG